MGDGVYDLIIVGAGPAGLSAARDASRLGLSYLLIERRHVADTISEFPIGKALFSTAEEVELVPGGLRCRADKPTREELLIHYTRFAVTHLQDVRTNEPVLSIRRDDTGFDVTTSKCGYRARNVLVATGVNGDHKRLGVVNEASFPVHYRFVEAFPFAGQRVVVTGSGHSAAEAAIFLEEVGASVVLAMRRPGFEADPVTGKAAIKWWVRKPLEKLVEMGRLDLRFSTMIVELTEDSVILASADTERSRVPCDAVFALLGTTPDLSLLLDAGVEIGPDGHPVHDPQTFETNVRGLYVAGHITREPHIKGALRVGPLVVERVASLVEPQMI